MENTPEVSFEGDHVPVFANGDRPGLLFVTEEVAGAWLLVPG